LPAHLAEPRSAGITKPVRFHDCRHTAATSLLGRGIHPKVVADILGHSTVAITLDTYQPDDAGHAS